MKHTIKAFVVYYKPEYSDKPVIMLANYAMRGDGFAVVREQEFEIEIPDNYDPTATLIADLEEKKQRLRLELGKQLANIDQQISKLQALPMPVEA